MKKWSFHLFFLFLLLVICLRLVTPSVGESPPCAYPPVAFFSYSPLFPKIGELVTFNASASYDPYGYIVGYAWNFDDGNNTLVSAPIIDHSYVASGIYNVTLKLIDNHGFWNITSHLVSVQGNPVAAFEYYPKHPQTLEIILFNASSSTPNGGYIITYEWDFGDENTTTVSDPIMTHAYSNSGNYAIALNVTDSEGQWDTESKIITVSAPPEADFSYAPLVPRVYETVTFNASNSTSDGGYILSYEWDFGDGSSTELGMVITHSYTSIGDYVVTLNVTDSEGKWDVESKTIVVKPQREDLNEDGKVNILDMAMICKAYGAYLGDERWNPKMDLTDDGKINMLDAVMVAKAFHP